MSEDEIFDKICFILVKRKFDLNDDYNWFATVCTIL